MIINCLKALRINLVKPLSYNFAKKSQIIEIGPSLRNVLSQNLEYLKNNKSDLKDFMNILKFNSWTLKQQNRMFQLIKTVNQRKVNIVFFQQDPLSKEINDQLIQKPNDKNETNKEIQQPSYVRFSTYIQKSQGSKQAMCVDISILNKQPKIQQVFFVQDFQKHKKLSQKDRSLLKYYGPDIKLIPQYLYIILQQFVQNYGVNKQITDFIVDYSIYITHERNVILLFQKLKQYC